MYGKSIYAIAGWHLAISAFELGIMMPTIMAVLKGTEDGAEDRDGNWYSRPLPSLLYGVAPIIRAIFLLVTFGFGFSGFKSVSSGYKSFFVTLWIFVGWFITILEGLQLILALWYTLSAHPTTVIFPAIRFGIAALTVGNVHGRRSSMIGKYDDDDRY